MPSTSMIPSMDVSMLSADSHMKDESNGDFMFVDINDMSDTSHSDDDSLSDSDYSDDEDLEAAEELLRSVQSRRLSSASLASMASIGTISSMRGKPAAQIEERMIQKSVQRVQIGGMAVSVSNGSLQILGMPPMAHAGPQPQMGNRSQSVADMQTAMFGHNVIGQTQSAQEMDVDDGAMKPDDHLAKLLGGTPPRYTHDSLEGFFLESKPEYVQAWTNELTKAVREHDLKALQAKRDRGELLQACNNFGESIVHLVVRRGTPEMLRFLLQDAGVSMLVKCDLGRTPLHDAAWCLASNDKSYIMMALLLNESPMQLLITDSRGYTPLQYVPRAKWAECNAFLDRQFAKGRFASLCMTK